MSTCAIRLWITALAAVLFLTLFCTAFAAKEPSNSIADRSSGRIALRTPNAPSLACSPFSISFPAWTKMNRPYHQSLILTNDGDEDLVYTISEEEDPSVPTGISSDWLSTSSFAGIVTSGLNNADTGVVTIIPAGGNPAGIYTLSGRLILTGNWPSSPDTFQISFIVADTLYPPETDTVRTAVLSLVANNGAAVGEMGLGGVNMDYVATGGECDSSADVYLYTGSPIIAYIDDQGDTIANFSAFGNDYFSPVGFLPLSNRESFDTVGCEAYKSICLTRDSSFGIQTTIFAPKAPAAADSNNFILKRLRIYPKDGQSHSNVTIGEVIDWDVPSDSAQNNGSDFNASERMIWQYGGEYHQDDTGATPACQDSDHRFAGIKFLQMKKGPLDLTNASPVSAYAADNATFVFGNPYGFEPSEIFTQMETEAGFSKFESAHPDSVYVDLHSVMTFSNNMNFGATDTVTIWMALITVREGTATDFAHAAAKAKKWWENHLVFINPGIMRGDMNCDNKVIVSDLTYLVNFLFKGGPPPCVARHGDVNCDNKTIVSDLTYLANFLFKGGPPPCFG